MKSPALVVLLAALCAATNSARAQTAVAPPIRVEGVVRDSLDALPLSGAIVQLIASPPAHGTYAAIADSAGNFHIDSVHPGTYIAGFQHPLLDTLGVNAPYGRVVVSDGHAAHLVLAIPSAPTLARAICGEMPLVKGKSAKPGADTTGVLVGHVRDGATGAPTASSAVTVTWTALALGPSGTHMESRSLRSTTNADGWFAVCRLAANNYQVHAEHGSSTTGSVDVEVHPRGLARVSLSLGGASDSAVVDTGAQHGAIITGTVTAHDGHGLEGAQIVVEGTSITSTTDARGTFVLSGLPEGTRTAEIRALGYEPVRIPITPRRAQQGIVSVVMGKKVETLGAVTVFGKTPPRKPDVTGFEQRMKRGYGKFITAAEIEQANVVTMCELLRRRSGLIVVDDGMGACRVQIRQAVTGADMGGARAVPHPCEPSIYDDAIQFGGTVAEFTRMVPLHDIMGIEIYTSATQPTQFSGGCGSIVVWTRQTAIR
jgi:Carboxypeptidase regulatory-like domain